LQKDKFSLYFIIAFLWLFVINSLRFHLQKTAFGFDLPQTAAEISLFLHKKYSDASNFAKDKNAIFIGYCQT
jgi:hypothetical protein